jgi:hypothetical protein
VHPLDDLAHLVDERLRVGGRFLVSGDGERLVVEWLSDDLYGGA